MLRFSLDKNPGTSQFRRMQVVDGRISNRNNQTTVPFNRATFRSLRDRVGVTAPGFTLALFLSFVSSVPSQVPPGFVQVNTDNPSATYAVGDRIRWNIEPASRSGLSQGGYTLKQNGLTAIREGRLGLQGGDSVDATMDQPGTLLLEVKATDTSNRALRFLGGAVIAAEKIQPSMPRPDDFDAFWDGKLKELAAVPANPQLTAGDSGNPQVDYWQITMDNIRGSHIHGQLARPKAGEKLPAMLIVQWAGVYGLDKSWVLQPATAGWLVLNISAHDLPIDKAPEFYKEQSEGPLKDYTGIGNDNRDTSYFLRMYLSCYRAAQYLAERPDWDGTTFLVTGGSQGGMQALMTAGFHPRITAAIANVPAGCDLTGPKAGRSPGWPQWYWKTEGKDPAKVIEASRYYDVMNFASRIKCPILVGVGLIDEVCPPAGILATVNQAKGPKEIVLLPKGDHQGTGNSHQAFNDRANAWKTQLRDGGLPVIPAKSGQSK